MKTAVALVGISMLTVACTPSDDKQVELKTDDEKTFYAIGYEWGERLKTFNLSDGEVDALKKGINASLKEGKAEIEVATYSARVQAMVQARMASNAAQEKARGEKFVADYLEKNKNAKKTESGLVYEMLKEGTGKSPKATDTVEVHYHGTLITGKVFDSSVERNKTIKFPLNQVIKGWTEGLQLLKEGGKIKLIIPSDLAYGEAGAPPRIPGGATLVFEIELFKVNP